MVVHYHWHHYIDSPELKKYLIQEKHGSKYYLIDTRTDEVVLSGYTDLSEHLHGDISLTKSKD